LTFILLRFMFPSVYEVAESVGTLGISSEIISTETVTFSILFENGMQI
jgi:hypothetical protein